MLLKGRWQMADKMKTVSIMDIDFLSITKEELMRDLIIPKLEKREKCFIVTANPEIVMKTRQNKQYREYVRSADYTIADGIGIVKAAEWKGDPLPERIAGFDVMCDLLIEAEEKGYRCFFLGAEENVNALAVEKIRKQHPNLQIAGRHHGFFDLDDEAIVQTVLNSKPDLVFVALGLPRQESWIAKHIDRFDKGLFMGVGGSFDVFAGEVKRAPDIWIKLNLEWAYRALKQPTRILRLVTVFQFLFRARFKR